jgi:microcystin-dependent protein
MAEPYLGEIRIIAFGFAPKGWALCNGQLMAISQAQALFSIQGTTYGGNGVTNFALPNFQGRTGVHVGGGILLGQSGGETAHALTIPEMPGHSHTPQGNSATANSSTPVGDSWAANSSQPYGTATDATLSASAVATTGGSQPHNNLQPYTVLKFIIALQGIFPTQN